MAGRPDAAPTDGGDSCFFDVAFRLGGASPSSALHVASAGGGPEVILDGFRLAPGACIVILHASAHADEARRAREAFAHAGISASTRPVEDAPFLGTLRGVSELIHEARVQYERVILNVASGSPADGCALTTAAYLHGVEAFHVEAGAASFLPILPHGQREILAEPKLRMLQALGAAPSAGLTTAKLASLGDVRTHLHGEPGRDGLVKLGLVRVRRRFGFRPLVTLTPVGRAVLASGLIATTVERQVQPS